MPIRARRFAPPGFTLIEMMIVIAIGAVVLVLAAPSFRDYILMQRLKGINAQLVTDLALARSEAVSRGVEVHVKVIENAQSSCYILYTTTFPANAAQGVRRCDCNQPEGSRCPAGSFVEIKTVQVPRSLEVRVSPNKPVFATNNCLIPAPGLATRCSHMYFDPRTGGMTTTTLDAVPLALDEFEVETAIDATRRLLDKVGVSGRTSVCVPTGARVTGVSPC